MKTVRNNQKRRIIRTSPVDQSLTGVFKSQEYYGFIEGRDLYVRGENMNTALNKDLVEYIIIEYEDHNGEIRSEGKIINVLERAKTLFVGEIIHQEPSSDLVLLDSQKLNKVVSIPPTGLPIGEKIQIQLHNFQPDHLQGDFVKSLGHRNDAGIEVKAVLEDFGVAYEFPQKIKTIVQDINLDIEKKEQEEIRKDFTHIPFVTIDPTNSKDFDDAVCVLKKKDKYELYVAIADVWSYIRQYPELIKEAESRATSIYFLDSVVPMLPEKLCNNYCSLVPDNKRCAIIMNALIDADGNVLWDTVKIHPGIIKSRRRFSYDEVNTFFEGKDNLQDSEEIKQSLRDSHELYKLLEKKRVERGYVSIEVPETKIKINDKGMIESCSKYVRKEAQFMIENFMILTNEIIAKYMSDNNIPALFRVHDRPEPNKVATFIGEVKKLNFVVRDGDENITQKIILRWFTENKNHPLIETISILFLRSSQKALYSITNTGHFGLNLKNYLHFTSPIRRYPDTIVHRMMWEYIFEKKPKPIGNHDAVYRELDAIAKHCNEKEISASEISRSIENVQIMKWLNTKLEKIFKAQVVSPSKFGGFVKIQHLNIEGFVKCKDILKLGDWLLVKPMHNSKEFKLIQIMQN